jgi:hypothetical protein
MQDQLAGRNKMLGEDVLEQQFEQVGTFRVGDIPTDDSSAEDIDDHVKVEVGPGPISLLMSQDQTRLGLWASNSGFW